MTDWSIEQEIKNQIAMLTSADTLNNVAAEALVHSRRIGQALAWLDTHASKMLSKVRAASHAVMAADNSSNRESNEGLANIREYKQYPYLVLVFW